MPFTTSHTAIVLPLKKLFPKWFSLTGLMAGAMSPDLIYFLTCITEDRGTSHSWTGLFIYCLPAGVLFSIAFHKFFKYHAILNLPTLFRRPLEGLALSPFELKSGGDWLKLIMSVLVGTLSHFFWDSFTHTTGEISQAWLFLREYITIGGYTMRVTRFVQHFSTLLGGVLLLVAFFTGWVIPATDKRLPDRSIGQKFMFWLIVFIGDCLFIALAYYFWFWFDASLVAYPWTTLGLASWAGIFWTVVVYSCVRRKSSLLDAGSSPA